MYVLGVNRQHNASAALLQRGKIIAAAEEERFSRNKYDGQFPSEAIDFCLDYADITKRDVDHAALSWDWLKIIKKPWKYRPYVQRNVTRPHIIGYHFASGMKDFVYDFKQLARECDATEHFLDHHLTHAASAFWGSPFEEANIITLDGRGELDTGMLALGRDSSIDVHERIPLPHSLGELWRSTTKYLGFSSRDEGKVMGLASYGDPVYTDFFDDIVDLTEDGFEIDSNYLWNYMYPSESSFYANAYERRLGPPRDGDHPLSDERYANIAASLQSKTDEIAAHLVRLMHRRTGCRNVTLAGGVALNCVMNGHLLQLDCVDEIYIHPAASDAGTALGAAQLVYSRKTGVRPEPVDTVDWGLDYNNEEIKALLNQSKLEYSEVESPGNVAAEHLADEKIVGWFQGRTEWGPRSLGRRSILANPTIEGMKDEVNEHVKNRENWRPFAPSMLAEAKDTYLENAHESPFMILSFDVVKDKRDDVPAITHVDGSTRPQTVTKDRVPKYYSLIEEFQSLTGEAVVLNTSFNLAGEPIVNTPQQALSDFAVSGMDTLVIGDYVVSK